jgi:signal transduction histidine kinase
VMRAVADAAEFTVTVRDHGAGFDDEQSTTHFGVANSIVGRMREVGGDARVRSSPGNGTLVTLTIPRSTEA